MVFVFCSTSKISYPGSGLAAMGASFHNIQNIKMQMAVQTIGNDKMNQLRHVRFFGNKQGVLEHMKKHAELIRPKFQLVERILEEELGFCGIARWTNPKGGYFISLDTQPGCAKRVISLCRQAGVAHDSGGFHLSLRNGSGGFQHPNCANLSHTGRTGACNENSLSVHQNRDYRKDDCPSVRTGNSTPKCLCDCTVAA